MPRTRPRLAPISISTQRLSSRSKLKPRAISKPKQQQYHQSAGATRPITITATATTATTTTTTTDIWPGLSIEFARYYTLALIN